jgi:uncharacterized protein YuzE
MRLYVQKDKANDQIYIGFSHNGPGKRALVKKTVRATPDVALDLDTRGRLVGIDIGNASRVLGRRAFTEPVANDELVGVAEAARLCGVKKPNFIRDFAGRPEFPAPIAELAGGRIWRRSEIEAYLQAKRRSSEQLRHIA